MMNTDFNLISQIATTIAAFLTAGSIFAGFYIYKMGIRDEKLRTIRETMIVGKAIIEKMDNMLNYELTCEISQAILATQQIQLLINDVFNIFFRDNTKTNKELDDYLEVNMPQVLASLRSPCTQDFEQNLSLADLNAAKVEYDFPAVARTLYASGRILKNTYYNQKKLVQEEDAWKTAIKQLFEEERDKISSVDILQVKISSLFIGTALSFLREGWQKNIDDTLKFLDITIRSYLEMSPDQLESASRNEKNTILMPLNETKTVSDNLREAEKAFEKILSHEKLMLLRQYSSQIAAR